MRGERQKMRERGRERNMINKKNLRKRGFTGYSKVGKVRDRKEGRYEQDKNDDDERWTAQ